MRNLESGAGQLWLTIIRQLRRSIVEAGNSCYLARDGWSARIFIGSPHRRTSLAGPRGSRDLDTRGLLGRDGVGMITPEPTGVIWNANRGAMAPRATMRGKAAQVGRQFEGASAFERSLPAIARLADLKKEVKLTRPGWLSIAPPVD